MRPGAHFGGEFPGDVPTALFTGRWGKVAIRRAHKFSGEELFTGSERGPVRTSA
jgi:hypothetical protein